MANFFLQTVGITDTNYFKVAAFIKPEKNDTPFGAVGKGGERFEEPLQSPTVCRLYLNVGKFALVLLDFGYQLLELFAGHE